MLTFFIILGGQNKLFSNTHSQYYFFDRHLCPGGKLEFSGLWKPGNNGSSNPHPRALHMEIKAAEPIKAPRDKRVLEKTLFFGIYTHPKLHVSTWRHSTPLNSRYEFEKNFEFEKLYHGYLSCQESTLDVYFMDKYLYSFKDISTFHGPYDKVLLYVANGFFELRGLVMSECK